MPTYLTETTRMVDGEPRRWCGPRVEAENEWEAQAECDRLGIEYVGLFTGEIDAGESIGRTIQILRDMNSPEEMIKDILDVKRALDSGEITCS